MCADLKCTPQALNLKRRTGVFKLGVHFLKAGNRNKYHRVRVWAACFGITEADAKAMLLEANREALAVPTAN